MTKRVKTQRMLLSKNMPPCYLVVIRAKIASLRISLRGIASLGVSLRGIASLAVSLRGIALSTVGMAIVGFSRLLKRKRTRRRLTKTEASKLTSGWQTSGFGGHALRGSWRRRLLVGEGAFGGYCRLAKETRVFQGIPWEEEMFFMWASTGKRRAWTRRPFSAFEA